jgi:hypothetical protein
MTSKRLQTIRIELESLRQRGGVRTRDLEGLAKKLGMRIVGKGKHLSWGSESILFYGLRPVTIPTHPGDLNKFTARAIIGQLEGYLIKLEESDEEANSGK